MDTRGLIELLTTGTKGDNDLSGLVFNFLVNNDLAHGLFSWQEAGVNMFPPLTESIDVSSEAFVRKEMELDIRVQAHTCKVCLLLKGKKVVDVSTAGKDCIPRAICAAGLEYSLHFSM